MKTAPVLDIKAGAFKLATVSGKQPGPVCYHHKAVQHISEETDSDRLTVVHFPVSEDIM